MTAPVVGQRFGRLVRMYATTKRNKWGNIIWRFKCDCGNEKDLPSGQVGKGGTRSCGCLGSESSLRNIKNAPKTPQPTHCVKGHSQAGDGRYVSPAGKGECRTCHISSSSAYNVRMRSNPKFRARIRKHSRHYRAMKLNQLGLWNHLETKLIFLMRKAQQGLCIFCKGVMGPELPKHHPQKETLEHMIPLSRGGSHGFDNWALSCWACNHAKQARTAEEFRGVL